MQKDPQFAISSLFIGEKQNYPFRVHNLSVHLGLQQSFCYQEFDFRDLWALQQSAKSIFAEVIWALVPPRKPIPETHALTKITFMERQLWMLHIHPQTFEGQLKLWQALATYLWQLLSSSPRYIHITGEAEYRKATEGSLVSS